MFVKKIFDDCIFKQKKMKELAERWEDAIKSSIHMQVDELTKPGDHINEQKIRQYVM